MINIGLIQPNNPQGGNTYSGYWLPYSVACVFSYAKHLPEFKDLIHANNIIFKKTHTDKIAPILAKNSINLFSCYLWSWQYNLKLAKKVKELNPNTIIVFGGPQVSEHRLHEQQINFPFVDSWIVSEGELSFVKFLNDYLSDSIQATYNAERLENLDYPSPYQQGFFDNLIKNNPDIKWSTIVETNRGCPFKCTFCDWGSLTYAKIKKFPVNRVNHDIEWIGKNKIEFVFIGDANFGVFPDRDMQFTKLMIQVQNQYGYPEVWSANWHKNSKQNVIPILKELSKNTKNRSMTISVQSMNQETQKAIERFNMDTSHLSDMVKEVDYQELSSYTELILPLPMETEKSWREGLVEVLNLGQHKSIEIWFHQLLENAESNKTHVEKYDFKIKTIKGLFGDYEIDSDNENIDEFVNIVVGTNTMTYEEFLRSWQFSSIIINFHLGGWTQLISRILVNQGKTTYLEFYEKLFDAISKDNGIIGEFWNNQLSDLEKFLNGHTGDGFYGYKLLWQLNFNFHNSPQDVWKFVEKNIDVSADLLDAQKLFVYDFSEIYPKMVETKYNYFDILREKNFVLSEGKYIYKIDPTFKSNSLLEHRENVYFKRRMAYGKITPIKL